MFAVRVKISPIAILFALSAPSAHSATEGTSSPEDFYGLTLAELGQVEVSIATGNATPIDRAPATATVISSSEIQAMGARTLNEVLESVPGIHVSASSLSRLDYVYSIRGIHTGFNPQVLMLVNGVPLQYNYQGSRPTLLRLPVTSIERIEVMRGPGSAVYGADAYAGVINVITKDADAIGLTRIGGGVGSFNSRDLWLETASEWKGVKIGLTMAYEESDGDDSRIIDADLQSSMDKEFGTDASLAPGPLSTRYKLLDTHLALSSESVQFNLWSWHSTDAGLGAGASQALDPHGYDESDLWLGDLTYYFNNAQSDWDNNIRLSHLYYDNATQFTLLPPGTKLQIGGDGNIDLQNPVGQVEFPDGYIGNPSGMARDSQFDFVSVYKGFDDHRLRMALGSKYQSIEFFEQKNFGPGVIDGTQPIVGGTLTDVSGTDYIFLPSSSRTINYISVQDEWRWSDDWQVTTGVRYDNFSDFGSTTNPRVALVWSPNDKFTSKLLSASAFRAPSFAELFTRNNPVSRGNPNLKPERIDTTELALAYAFNDNFTSNLTIFEYRARDMIEFMPDENATTKTASNARDQDGRGFELELNWKPTSALRFATSYSRQNAHDTHTSASTPDAPQQQVKANVNWEFRPLWSLNGQAFWVADRPRMIHDMRPEISDYTQVNLTLRRKNIIPKLDASLSITNLTDEDIREPSTGEIPDDYPMQSRSVWFKLHYKFN